MKVHYLKPTTEMLLLHFEETICGVSGEDYTLKNGDNNDPEAMYDDDSD